MINSNTGVLHDPRKYLGMCAGQYHLSPDMPIVVHPSTQQMIHELRDELRLLKAEKKALKAQKNVLKIQKRKLRDENDVLQDKKKKLQDAKKALKTENTELKEANRQLEEQIAAYTLANLSTP